MSIYAKHKESGLYLADNGVSVTFVADISQASDISEVADIFKESDDFELVEV